MIILMAHLRSLTFILRKLSTVDVKTKLENTVKRPAIPEKQHHINALEVSVLGRRKWILQLLHLLESGSKIWQWHCITFTQHTVRYTLTTVKNFIESDSKQQSLKDQELMEINGPIARMMSHVILSPDSQSIPQPWIIFTLYFRFCLHT